MAIKERRWTDAYAVSASAGLTEGADFAEAEFLAGWMQLRFLGDTSRALAGTREARAAGEAEEEDAGRGGRRGERLVTRR